MTAHLTRPRFLHTPAGALLARHPVTRELVLWHKSSSHTYTPSPLDTSALPERYTLGAGLLCEHIALVDHDTRSLELRALPSLALSERVRLQAGVRGMWSSGRYIYQMTTSPSLLLTFDMDTSQRTSCATPAIDLILDSHLSSCGGWLVVVGLLHERVVERVYALHDPLYPRLHLDGIDARGIDSPLASRAMADLSVWCGEEAMFVCLSRLGEEAYRWAGWRASVASVELATGKLCWHAELDAEVTGDWRGIADLGKESGFAPAMCASGKRLWVGGQDASVWELDARDGALRTPHYHAGAHGTLAMHHDASCDKLVLMNERGQVHVLSV